MGKDKAELSYRADGRPQWLTTAQLLSAVTEEVYLSVRPGQMVRESVTLRPEQILPDRSSSEGPLSGILTAMAHRPDAAWLVAACDLPLLTTDVLEFLITHRGPIALAYESSFDGLPEPLCTLYEPNMHDVFERYLADGNRCPRKVLIREASQVQLLKLPRADALENANTPEDYERLSAKALTLA
jgi:molybdopterin-guanine dinucleotide biosynthesis protein A